MLQASQSLCLSVFFFNRWSQSQISKLPASEKATSLFDGSSLHGWKGHAVADWSDPKRELCEAGPIGLQLHSNKVAQELHFRGLVLIENSEDKLITVIK